MGRKENLLMTPAEIDSVQEYYSEPTNVSTGYEQNIAGEQLLKTLDFIGSNFIDDKCGIYISESQWREIRRQAWAEVDNIPNKAV